MRDKNPPPSSLDVVYATRRKNLRTLAREYKEDKKLAAKCGYSAAYMNHLIGKNPSRMITERTARSIEAKLNLPAGWLDLARG